MGYTPRTKNQRAIWREIKMEQAEAAVEDGGSQRFHGGCNRCVQPLTVCRGCQYFDAQWSLPDKHKDEP